MGGKGPPPARKHEHLLGQFLTNEALDLLLRNAPLFRSAVAEALLGSARPLWEVIKNTTHAAKKRRGRYNQNSF